MAEQSLIDYIKAHINTYSQEQIRQGLVQSGWDQGSIDAAFREVLSGQPPGPGPAPLPKQAAWVLQESPGWF